MQRVLDYLHAEKRAGRSSHRLTELSAATGLAPATTERTMTQLETEGPYTIERVDTDSGTPVWHVRGSAYDVDGWETDVWNVRR